MTISQELYAAILSLDSYNRGYEPQLKVEGSGIGTAILDIRDTPLAWKAAGFYAASYSLGGKTVISYRGTTFDGAAGPNSNPRQ